MVLERIQKEDDIKKLKESELDTLAFVSFWLKRSVKREDIWLPI